MIRKAFRNNTSSSNKDMITKCYSRKNYSSSSYYTMLSNIGITPNVMF